MSWRREVPALCWMKRYLINAEAIFVGEKLMIVSGPSTKIPNSKNCGRFSYAENLRNLPNHIKLRDARRQNIE